MISVKIDVSKIDKSHLFEGKNGARYLDIILIETPDNRFGNDYMVAQSISKEARESGAKGPILGNGKVVGKGKPTAKKAAADEDTPF